MISTAELLWHEKNTMNFKFVNVTSYTDLSPNRCATLIRTGEYDAKFDLNNDGFVDVDDYNAIYDMWFGKWDAWHDGQTFIPYPEQENKGNPIDVRALVRQKKIVAGQLPFEPMFDLDNDGHVTEADIKILRNWLLIYDKEKPPREVF